MVCIALIVVIYFIWFFPSLCEDVDCYIEKQVKCSRAKFVNDGASVTWEYKILGKSDGRCEVRVTALQIKEGSSDKSILEGKSMVCELFIGNESMPDEDISQCKGGLKEKLQDLIIQNLHKYILENLGEIGAEIGSA